MNRRLRRRVEILLPATVTLLAVVAAVLLSPHLHLLPGGDRRCGLRVATGYPCLACGGTRSMQSLAAGKVGAALRFNPLVFFGVCAAVVWFLRALWRSADPDRTGASSGGRQRALRWWLIGLALVAFLNWLYLVKFLPG